MQRDAAKDVDKGGEINATTRVDAESQQLMAKTPATRARTELPISKPTQNRQVTILMETDQNVADVDANPSHPATLTSLQARTTHSELPDEKSSVSNVIKVVDHVTKTSRLLMVA